MTKFLVIALLAILLASASVAVFDLISIIRLKAKCRRLKRELDQAIADAEKRIHDHDDREESRL